MENLDWKDLLGAAFNIEAGAQEVETPEEASRPSMLEQQGKRMIDIILDKKGRHGKKATILEGLTLDDESVKELAGELKRTCGVGGSARGGEILIQGDARKQVLDYLVAKGFKARIIG